MEGIYYFILIIIYFSLGFSMLISKRKENNYLAAFFFLNGIRYDLNLMYAKYDLASIDVLFHGAMAFFGTALCVTLYAYFQSILKHKLYTNKKLLFVPLYLVLFYILIYQTGFIDAYSVNNEWKGVFYYRVIFGVLFVWLYLKTIKQIGEQLADYEYKNRQQLLLLSWGRIYLIVQIIIVVFQMVILTMVEMPNVTIVSIDDISSYFGSILNPIVTPLAFSIAYFVLRNPRAFEYKYISQDKNAERATLEQRISEVILPKQLKSNTEINLLSEQEFVDIEKKIKKALEVDWIYLNQSIRLKEFAAQLNERAKHISFVINKQWNVNFKDLLNQYRVEHAKGILADPEQQNQTLYSIAIDSGFNSESSFYVVFKQKTGQTPNSFRTQALDLKSSK